MLPIDFAVRTGCDETEVGIDGQISRPVADMIVARKFEKVGRA